MTFLLGFIVLLSFLVEAAAGFGSMVIALTLGALWFDVEALLRWLVPVNLVLSVWLVVQGRRHVRLGFLLRSVAPVMGLGLLGGMMCASRVAEAWWLKPLFGVFVMAVAARQLVTTLRPEGAPSPLPAAARLGALAAAGLIHGIFATGGPLAVFVIARQLPGKSEFRATLSMLWAVLNAVLVVSWAMDGKFSQAGLTTSALMLVPLALGILVGEVLHRRLDQRRFSIAVAVLLALAGLVLTITSAVKGLA